MYVDYVSGERGVGTGSTDFSCFTLPLGSERMMKIGMLGKVLQLPKVCRVSYKTYKTQVMILFVPSVVLGEKIPSNCLISWRGEKEIQWLYIGQSSLAPISQFGWLIDSIIPLLIDSFTCSSNSIDSHLYDVPGVWLHWQAKRRRIVSFHDTVWKMYSWLPHASASGLERP